MNLYAAGSVGNASDIFSTRMRMTPGKPRVSNKRYGDTLGMETASSVAAENLAPAPVWVTETASRATEQALGEECAADRRTAVADPVRRITELYIIAVLDGLRVGAPPRSPQLAAGLSEIVCDGCAKKSRCIIFCGHHELRTRVRLNISRYPEVSESTVVKPIGAAGQATLRGLYRNLQCPNRACLRD